MTGPSNLPGLARPVYDLHYDGKRRKWVIRRTLTSEVRTFDDHEDASAFLDGLREFPSESNETRTENQ